MAWIWLLLFLLAFITLAYHRASLVIWSISAILYLILFTRFSAGLFAPITAWVIGAIIFIPLLISPIRRCFISKPLLKIYHNQIPPMSRTEKEAIAAGTVTWEGELFKGNPNWHAFLDLPQATLREEEQAFLDGPVETLCGMLNDWEITHELADLPPAVWTFIKEQGFFGLIIPKNYGGKAFSAFAHSQVLVKVSSRSITAASIVAVPNSLGPAELLLHYGTEAQKQYYLPRLATGEIVPCFALTSPLAGSDAGSMVDHGIVCYGEHEGEQTLGIRLDFDKRYITLAPIANVIGLAFKLYDPDHLLGDIEDIGITCALLPRETKGIEIGRRHFPLNVPFQNGPIHGRDVFIPIDWIIGGKEQAGHGWRMLMECLANGRSISLPAISLGGAKVLAYTAGAYARIRRQFNQPIGTFEGIQAPLARIGAYVYIMDAARSFVAASLDSGEHSAVAASIVKAHVTELGRKVACDGMDIYGGKGICLGPRNPVGRAYQALPIAITVEGANILTRCLMIFGQGAMRCHPYVLRELNAAALGDIHLFDEAIIKHVAFNISNIVRSMTLSLTSGFIVSAPNSRMHRYYQHVTRFASNFALMAEVAMLSLGGNLKRKENLSARLGDILSSLYLLSAVLKHYHNQAEPADDLPVVEMACSYLLFEIQTYFDEFLQNFPNRPLAWLMRAMIFPIGKRFKKPKDKLNRAIASLLIAHTDARTRLANGIFIDGLSILQEALIKTIATESIEKIIKQAKKAGQLKGYTEHEEAQSALDQALITQEDFDKLIEAITAREAAIAVDDFASGEI